MPEDVHTGAPDEFVVGAYIQPTIEAFLQQGGRLSALASAIGKSDLWLYKPPIRINIADYFALLQTASELCQDPYLGLRSGQLADLNSFDVLGDAIAVAKTLAEALQQVMLLERLVHRLGESSIQLEDNNLRLLWRSRFRSHPVNRLVCENVLSGIIQLAQRLAGRSIPVLEMTFEHRQPDQYRRDYYQVLCQGECRFDQPHNSLLIAADVLAWPLRSSLVQPTRMAGQPVTEQLAELLAQRLMHHPRLAQMAAIMGMSERSLQRALRKEEQNFQGVLAQVRLRQACDYLEYSTMSLIQISQMLGFREQSSFNHFLVAQTGQSPKQFRQQARNVNSPSAST
ncbi:AraC family transcriptional regulator [Aestuariirhabdus sp. Z084]|uniref:AraC family transcriptional regulator n=1 Tax=Aestuariirhabdus haliotis TaxID=2918751 RepID=UPI00201B44B6|nr:AraC family transcriptional regulator [Aestuariirhabdus haliotis]MCL6416947.1 AraC family transcriptional regulator [Aestuariirhabdus haliotis]MCL6420950.1 AraC family transcriptional regulator [Aestuariirhabdus haliotis]